MARKLRTAFDLAIASQTGKAHTASRDDAEADKKSEGGAEGGAGTPVKLPPPPFEYDLNRLSRRFNGNAASSSGEGSGSHTNRDSGGGGDGSRDGALYDAESTSSAGSSAGSSTGSSAVGSTVGSAALGSTQAASGSSSATSSGTKDGTKGTVQPVPHGTGESPETVGNSFTAPFTPSSNTNTNTNTKQGTVGAADDCTSTAGVEEGQAINVEHMELSNTARSPLKGSPLPPLLHRSSPITTPPQLPVLSLLSKPGGPRVSEFNEASPSGLATPQ
jgi:hypothetical protein